MFTVRWVVFDARQCRRTSCTGLALMSRPLFKKIGFLERTSLSP